MVAVDHVKTSQHGLEDRSLFKAPTLLVHTEEEHVKLDGNTMTCHWTQPALYPAHALSFGFPRSKQNERNRVDPFMHKTPATGSRVFDFHRVCAESEKSTRTFGSIRAVHCVVSTTDSGW